MAPHSRVPLSITVEPRHLPEHSSPGRQTFAYVVRIENKDDQTWQIVARHWHVREADGAEIVVDGEGVVGQQPLLAPGGVFVYDSAVTVAAAPAQMSGHYLLKNAWGEAGRADIPAFGLNLGGPRTLH
ncbi:Co2+/Mg2+ efflux protein ApaG [Deinococcus lacus]|uniref:Co2+/Mg2+ efflux protein ApaG n=1 Tax=Deinococcus lacus TaxID=392561 RepID=A0ABW1YEH1_9DEIO